MSCALALLWALLVPSLRTLAVRAEILDPRETPYVLSRAEDFGGDLACLGRRLLSLYDAPPLSDARRLPPRKVAQDMCAFNRAYADHLSQLQDCYPAAYWRIREVVAETRELYSAWDAIQDAGCEYYYVTVRREAMKRLRDELIGPEAYYLGNWPPPVPVWRFTSAD